MQYGCNGTRRACHFALAPGLVRQQRDKRHAKIFFHLHENVMFHDGTPCDAAVKWNFDDLLSREKTSWVYSYFTQVESTEAVDPLTFHMKPWRLR